jgi:GTP-binding protein EngB required for normal cell division
MVFHLVDSRHKLTAVDQQMMVMATRAAATRKEEHRTPLRFAVVLTKTDRASEKALRESIADVKQGTKELAAVLDVETIPILLTSSVARQGRDELWRLLIESLSYAKQ